MAGEAQELAGAKATTGPQWGQIFRYDGFGNMFAQTVTKGQALTLSVVVDPGANWITMGGYSSEANGKLDCRERDQLTKRM